MSALAFRRTTGADRFCAACGWTRGGMKNAIEGVVRLRRPR